MDSDRDGRVAVHEVQSMLERLGICLREDVVHDLVRQASQSGITIARFSVVSLKDSMRSSAAIKQRVWTNFKRGKMSFVGNLISHEIGSVRGVLPVEVSL